MRYNPLSLFKLPFSRFLRQFHRQERSRKGKKPRKHHRYRPWLEALEDRTSPDVTASIAAPWTEVGPGPLSNGVVVGLSVPDPMDPAKMIQNPVAGAIRAIAVDPNNSQTVYIGTTNGGVWKTTDITAVNPVWETHTDQMPSLSIGALAVHNLDSNLVYAGTGNFSSGLYGGPALGVLKSTDGGRNWEVVGRTNLEGLAITSIVLNPANKEELLVGTRVEKTGKQAGVYRSTNGGKTWTRITGMGNLVNGDVSDLILDPDPAQNRIYAALPGRGIFRATNIFGGTANNSVNWTKVSDPLVSALAYDIPNSTNLKLALSRAGGISALYVGIVDSTEALEGIAQTKNQGTTWNDMSGPVTTDTEFLGDLNKNGMVDPATELKVTMNSLHTLGQGVANFSLEADQTQADTVYIGGDAQPIIPSSNAILMESSVIGAFTIQNKKFTGRLFQGAIQPDGTTQWKPITDNNANNTAPHADSRDMVYVPGASPFILETDDGGIYRLKAPNTNPVWESVNGNLRITEVEGVAYDSVGHIIFSGNQDNAISQQTSSSSQNWTTTLRGKFSDGTDRYFAGDGSTQGVDNVGTKDRSIHYSILNNLLSFYRIAFDNAASQKDLAPKDGNSMVEQIQLNGVVLGDNYNTNGQSGDAITVPYALQPVPRPAGGPDTLPRMLIGFHTLYESDDGGDNVTPISNDMQPGGYRENTISAVAFAPSAPDVIYRARGNEVGVRIPGDLAHPEMRKKKLGDPLDRTKKVDRNAGTIVDIVVDPADWRIAYAIDSTRVYATVDGGLHWKAISNKLKASNLITLEIVEIDATRRALLVGAQGGVFRALDPVDRTKPTLVANRNVTWIEFGSNMPNVPISSLVYDTADDVLVAGSFGRGTWKYNNARADLADLSKEIVRIEGTTNNDTITLTIDNARTKLNIKEGTTTTSVKLSQIARIEVQGSAGNDTLIVDVQNGMFLVPIDYFGGSGTNTLQFVNGTLTDATIESFSDATIANKGFVDVTKAGVRSTVHFEQVQTIQDNTVQPSLFEKARNLFLWGMNETLQRSGDLQEALGVEVAGISGMGRAANGVSPEEVKVFSDPIDVDVAVPLQKAPFQASQVFRRLFETDDGVFDFEEVGQTVTSLEELRQKLDDLDAVPGNVSFTDVDGVIRFDIQVTKTMSGDADLEAMILGGLAELSGSINLAATYTMHLVVGLDDTGFFLDVAGPQDQAGNPEPELVISNISGNVKGAGKIGFLGVELPDGMLDVADDVRIEVDIHEPATDPDPDGLLRLDEFETFDSTLTSTSVVAGATGGDPDVQISGTFQVSAFDFNLVGLDLTLQWPNINDLTTGTIVPGGEGAEAIKQFINTDLDQILASINNVADTFQQATGIDVLATQIPLLNKSIGEVLNGTPRELALPNESVSFISEPVTDGEFETFTVFLTGINLLQKGVTADNVVSYLPADSDTPVEGIIDDVTTGSFVVRFPAALNQPGPRTDNPSFTIIRSGDLQSQLGSLLGGVSFNLPTLQQLVGRLGEITGIDLFDMVKVTDTTPDDGQLDLSTLAIEIPVIFDPDPIVFEQRLDLSKQITGLQLDASANFDVTVDPRFEIVLGVRLTPGLNLNQRFYIVDNPDLQDHHEVTLDVTARLNDPVVQGSIGFLNVNLGEVRDPNAPEDDPDTPEDEDGNEGVEINLTVTLDVNDPQPEATSDGRVTLAEITSSPLLRNAEHPDGILSLSVRGFLDIDGLQITASVGDPNNALELGALRISLEGEGGLGSDGFVDSLSDIPDLFGKFQIDGDVGDALSAFTNFNNITPEQILAALSALIDQLTALGAGGIFQQPLPLVNKSVSDLVDLGQMFLHQIGSPDDPNNVGIASVATAQKLQDFINRKLDPDPTDDVVPNVVTITVTPGDIRFTFTFTRGLETPLSFPFALDLGDNLGLVNFSGDGEVEVDADATFTLTLGVSTATGPGIDFLDRVFLVTEDNASHVEVHATANAGYDLDGDGVQDTVPVTFQASVGPLSLTVQDARGLIDVSLGVALTDGPNDDGKLTLNEIAHPVDGIGSLFDPTFTGTVQAILPLDGDGGGVSNDPDDLPGSGDGRIELAGNVLDFIQGHIDFRADPEDPDQDIPHNITNPAIPLTQEEIAALNPSGEPGDFIIVSHNLDGLISNGVLNFNSLFDGLKQFIAWGQGLLGIDLLNVKIPFVGATIGEALDFFDDPANGVLKLVTDGEGVDVANLSIEVAANAIADALSKIPGVMPIEGRDFNNNGKADANELFTIDNTGGPINGVTFLLKFMPSFMLHRPFDIGLDFLNLQSEGAIDFQANLTLYLGFGINTTDGFFIKTDFSDVGVPASTPELQAEITATLDGKLAVQLGFLDVEATMNTPAHLTATFSADLADGPNDDRKLTIPELLNFSNAATFLEGGRPTFVIEAGVDAHLSTSINPDLPSLEADFVLDIPSGDVISGGISPTIDLQNIELNVGSFLSRVLTPVLQKIQDANIIPPAVFEALNSPLPLIDKKPIELLEENLTDSQKKVVDFIFNLVQFINEASQMAEEGEDLVIHFGDGISIGQGGSNSLTQLKGRRLVNVVALDGGTNAPPPTANEADLNVPEDTTYTANGMTKTETDQDIPGSKLPIVGEFIRDLAENFGITFPVLRLSNLGKLLTGSDVDLVVVELPRLELERSFGFEVPIATIGLPPIASASINAVIGGGFGLTVDLVAGFDTSGLRRGKFLDGFYLGDFDPGDNGQIEPTDPDRPEVQFTGNLHAGISAEVEVLGFDVGRVEGFLQLDASINVDLNDDHEDANGEVIGCDDRDEEDRHDGKMHLSEFRSVLRSHGNNPLSLFDLSGQLVLEVGLHVTVLGGFLLDQTISKEFTLLNFNLPGPPVNCVDNDNPPPVTNQPAELPPEVTVIDLAPEKVKPRVDFLGKSGKDVQILAESLNDNLWDGFTLVSIPTGFQSGTTIGALTGDRQFILSRNPNQAQFPGYGVEVGQGVEWTEEVQVNIPDVGPAIIPVERHGIITAVAADSLTIQLVPTFAPGLTTEQQENFTPPMRGQNIHVKSGKETLRIEINGNTERFGPQELATPGHYVSDISKIQLITMSDPAGFGPGADHVFVDPLIRTPMLLNGGGGDDTIIAGSGQVTLLGGSGNDILTVAPGPTNFKVALQLLEAIDLGEPSGIPAVRIEGGPGNDRITGGPGNDILLGGEGDDEIDGGLGHFVFEDVIVLGTSGNDIIVGGGGNDTINGRDGADLLVGDYDFQFDPVPTDPTLRHEGTDTINHSIGVGTATVFADNRDDPNAPTPAFGTASRNQGDLIAAVRSGDQITLGPGDQLVNQVTSGILIFDAQGRAVTVTANSITAEGLLPVSFLDAERIEIGNTNGSVTVLGDQNDNRLTLQKDLAGFLYRMDEGPDIVLTDVTTFAFRGSGGDDTLVLDTTFGNPIPSGGLRYDGEGSITSGGNHLFFQGEGSFNALVTPSAAISGNGTLSTSGRTVTFTGVQTVQVEDARSLTLNTQGAGSNLTIDVSTEDPAANRISGTSGKVRIADVVFANVPDVTLDTSATGGEDLITLASNGLVARNLRSFLVRTGDGNDTLTVNQAGLRLPATGGSFTFNGGAGTDRLRVIGTGREVGSYNPVGETAPDGQFVLDGNAQTVLGVESLMVSNLDSLNLVTGGSNDVLTVANAIGTANEPATAVFGTSGGRSLATLIFFDTPNFTLDAATFDNSNNPSDSVNFFVNSLSARGLRNFTLRTGQGNDSVTSSLTNFRLPVSGGALTFDGGTGTDGITASADVTFNLSNSALNSSAGGALALQGVELATLNGGASDNTFILNGWTGTATIDGAGGTDLLRLFGTTTQSGSYTASGTTPFKGTLVLGSKSNSLTSIEELEVRSLASFALVTGGSKDELILVDGLGPKGEPATVVGGTSDGLELALLTFFDVPSFTINASANDLGHDTNDTITVQSGALAARELQNFTVLTGVGNDTLAVGSDLRLPVPNGSYIYNGGSGSDEIVATGNVNFTLSNTSLASSGGGSIILQGSTVENATLTGGSSINTFTLNGYSGTATLNGAGGADNVSLNLTGGTVNTVDELTVLGTVTVNAASTTAHINGSLALSGTPTFSVFSGSTVSTALEVAATISGSGGLTKAGTGGMRLTGNNTYTGITSVTNGTLFVNGSQPSSPVNQTGGRLGGTGTIGPLTATAGIFSPGIDAGTLTVSGDVTFGSNLLFEVDVDKVGTGTTFDQLKVINNGHVDLGNAKLSFLLASTSDVGDVYRIIDNDGPNTDSIPTRFRDRSGDTIDNNEVIFEDFGDLFGRGVKVSYGSSTTNNDVNLTYVATSKLPNHAVTPVVVSGQAAVLTGNIGEPDVGDEFILEINWGDGTPTQTVVFPPDSHNQRISVPHVYINSTGQPVRHTVHFSWHDRHGAGNSDTAEVLVYSSTEQRHVVHLYQDLLGREADASGLAFWTGLLQQGASRVQVALGLLSSREYQAKVVQGLYQTLLDRPAEPQGLFFFTNFLTTGGSVDQVRVFLVTSPEYFIRRGGGTLDGFLTALYADALGRPVDDLARATFTGLFQRGFTLQQIAQVVFQSTEFRHRLGDDLFHRFLNRPAENGVIDVIDRAFPQGAREENVLLVIFSSEEYYARL
jgi:autotransporter-associated beta strand protein